MQDLTSLAVTPTIKDISFTAPPFLAGYKTYLTAAAGALATVAAVASGHLSPVDGAVALLMLGTQAFTRAGSKTDAAKVVAQVGAAAAVAETVAPIAADLSPQLAPLMQRIEELSVQVQASVARAVVNPDPAGINQLG